VADEGLGQVDEFRARRNELRGWSDWRFPRSHIRRKGALALIPGGENGTGLMPGR
jgi:hypothetical protein